MKIMQKVMLLTMLLISGLQLSAKNKDRIFVINNYGKEISARGLNDFTFVEKNIKKENSECLALSDMNRIFVIEKGVMMKSIYSASDAIKSGNVVVVTKKSRYTPKLKVYKNYDAFMKVNPDYQLNGKTCPSVLPAE